MADNKFCIECGFELLRTAKFCEECGAQLIVSETNKPETEVTETVEERPSYETNNSTKKENPIFLKEDPTKTKKKKKWYKHPLFICSMVYMIANYIYQAVMSAQLGASFQLGLIELISGPILFTIIYSIYKLVKVIMKSIKTRI